MHHRNGRFTPCRINRRFAIQMTFSFLAFFIGYVVAYGFSGLLADGMGNGLQIGVGRGAAAVIMASGVLLGMIALGIYPIKAVRELEKDLLTKVK